MVRNYPMVVLEVASHLVQAESVLVQVQGCKQMNGIMMWEMEDNVNKRTSNRIIPQPDMTDMIY